MSLFKRYAVVASLAAFTLSAGMIGCNDDDNNNVVELDNYTVTLFDANIAGGEGLLNLNTGDVFTAEEINADVAALSPEIDLIYTADLGDDVVYAPALEDADLLFPELWIDGVKNDTDVRSSTLDAFNNVDGAASEEDRQQALADAFAAGTPVDSLSIEGESVLVFQTAEGNIGIANVVPGANAGEIDLDVWVE